MQRKQPHDDYGKRKRDGQFHGESKRQNRAPNGRRDGRMENALEKKWLEGENEFLAQQLKRGAMIRVQDNRAEPIDWLAVNLIGMEENSSYYIDLIDEGKEFEIPHPFKLVQGLSPDQIHKIIPSIQEYQTFDKINADYWNMILILCQQSVSNDTPESRVVDVVANDIDNILVNKSFTELVDLESQVQTMLNVKDGTIDRDFWLQLSRRLKTEKAKAKLEEIQRQLSSARARHLRHAQEIIAQRAKLEIEDRLTRMNPGDKKVYKYIENPLSIQDSEVVETLTLDEFKTSLEVERRQVRNMGFISMKETIARRNETAEMFERRFISKNKEKTAAGTIKDPDLGFNEQYFNDDIEGYAGNVDSLIKPRFSNRILVGFDWNRYNRTHYNAENAPPNAIQGYKFNIYYPNLKDPEKMPSYKIIYSESERTPSDTCILVFKSPLPYHDVAFRIVNAPWDQSPHQSAQYRSKFENGVLQLHFRFKKSYYRT
jgi:hypothetical protein